MRDHRKLKAFHAAKQLALLIYQTTSTFPADERFGLVSQMRRCAVSIGSNIVEGSARASKADYLRFLDIAFGSTRELGFQAELSHELGFLSDTDAHNVSARINEVARLLHGLMDGLRDLR